MQNVENGQDIILIFFIGSGWLNYLFIIGQLNLKDKA